jgi:hypothetical protein
MEGDERSGWKPGMPSVFLNRRFPGGDGKWQISNESGMVPNWSYNGKELYDRNRESRIMVANYKVSGNSFQVYKPRLWSEVEIQVVFNRNFVLHPDGKRFAILRSPQGQVAERRDKLVMVETFFDELRRIAPSEKK